MKNLKGALVAGVAFCLVGSTPFIATQMANAQDNTVTVTVGGGEDDIAVNLFRAKEITVLEGTTVHFAWEYLEPHTVTFGIPTGNPTVPTPGADTEVVDFSGTEFISSGVIAGPAAALDVRFTTAGEYDYFCVLHPNMVGTVTVVESGDVDTQEEIDARGDTEYETELDTVRQLAATLSATPVSVTPKDNGGYTYEIRVGGDTADSAINRFFPKSQEITTADTVVWSNTEFTPHTVTFGELIPQGDPTEIAPIVPEDDTYDGTGTVHSGTLGNGWSGGTTFSLNFSKAGTYEYYCLLHAELGQVGEIVVTEATTPTPEPTNTPAPTSTPAPTNTPVPTNTPAPTNTAVPTNTAAPTNTTAPTNTAVPSTVPQPPNTGDGVQSRSSSNVSLLAAAGLLVALGGAGLLFATRRK